MATSVASRAPSWMDAITVDGATMRAEILGALLPAAGLVRGLNAQALPTPAMKVRLPAGLCMVDDGQGGFYPLQLATQTDLDIAASSATQARYDTVIAEVVDTGVVGTAIYRFRVLTGTPSGSPTAPTLPPADQPTAKTLRIADVFVQANAETNGFVRPQDVSIKAAGSLVVPRPVEQAQTAAMSGADFTTINAWIDMPSGKWAPLTFTAPPSGQVYVTLTANVQAKETASFATAWASWRGTGGGIASGTSGTLTDPRGISARQATRTYASKRVRVTGLTPGASVTLTPIYFMSATGDANMRVGEGTLIVEPIA